MIRHIFILICYFRPLNEIKSGTEGSDKGMIFKHIYIFLRLLGTQTGIEKVAGVKQVMYF